MTSLFEVTTNMVLTAAQTTFFWEDVAPAYWRAVMFSLQGAIAYPKAGYAVGLMSVKI